VLDAGGPVSGLGVLGVQVRPAMAGMFHEPVCDAENDRGLDHRSNR
jgi:hypothetical protein